MAYSIYKSDGTELLSLADYIIDQETLSINLVGKNVSGFGTAQNDNFVWLLEHFASVTPPKNPLAGQIWFDKDTSVLRPIVYDGGTWRPLAVTLVSTTSTVYTPAGNILSSQAVGDFWYKSDDNQLYVNTGSGYTLIGPESAPGFGVTKLSSTVAIDSSAGLHPVIEMKVNDEIVGIISQTTFNTSSTHAISGFPKIYRGLTLKNYNPTVRYSTSSTDVLFHGMLEQLDQSYPRRNQDEHIEGNWIIDDDKMFQFGTAGNAKISFISNNNEVRLDNPAGLTSIAANGGIITFDGTALYPFQSNQLDLGSTGLRYNNVYTANLNAGGATGQSSIVGTWALSLNSYLNPHSDAGNNLGQSTLRFNNVYTFGLSSGADIGSIKGQWQLDNNTNLSPKTDLSSILGGPTNRFSNIFTTGISASDAGQQLSVVGEVHIDGNIIPAADQLYNLGSPTGGRWNTIYSTSVIADSANVNNLTAIVNRLQDSFSNSIQRFDRDTQLSAASDTRLPTQAAVKAYVDQAKGVLFDAISQIETLLQNEINALQFVPVGAVFHVAQTSCPTGFLVCDGSTHSSVNYPRLFGAIGYTYGGDGNGNFQVPDLRGSFVRGWDNGKGLDAGRQFGSFQAEDAGTHQHYFDDTWLIQNDGSNPVTGDRNLDGSYGHPARDVDGLTDPSGRQQGGGYGIYQNPVDDTSYNDGGANDNSIWTIRNKTEAAGGTSSLHPSNVALLPIIKF